MTQDIYRRPAAGPHPANLSPEYKSTPGRAPRQPAIVLPQTPVGDHRPAARERAARCAGERPHQAALGRAARRAHRRAWPRARRGRQGRSRRRWSRSGSATPPAATTIPATSTTRRSIPTSTAAAGCAPTRTGRYQFITIKPGAYPWKNHHNAWRPAHIHFSLFGPAFATRLITQMYFPDDPLLAYDPIYNSVPAGARKRLQAAFDMESDAAGMGARLQVRHRAARPQRHAHGIGTCRRI